MLLYGLVGFPLGHSWSADYFNRRFRKEGPHEAVYRLFPVPSVFEIPTLIRSYPDLQGFNVTIPYKESIMEFLNETDPLASEIGSVNLVLVSRSGGQLRLKGFNTDAPAFRSTLPDPPGFRAALVLGTGGASRTISWVLRKAGISVLTVSRHPKGEGSISYQNLADDPGILARHTLVVNTTPLGMFPDTESYPAIPFEQLTGGHLLYDLVYNPEVTLFLRKGAERGARMFSGGDMFYAQAALGYDLFTGR